jgi:hypothetical protein
MSNSPVITLVALVAGAVAIVVVLVVKLRHRLSGVNVDLRRGTVNATMDRDEALAASGARQRGIDAAGNVVVRDETGVGASQENVKAGGDVSAIVKPPARAASKKKP